MKVTSLGEEREILGRRRGIFRCLLQYLIFSVIIIRHHHSSPIDAVAIFEPSLPTGRNKQQLTTTTIKQKADPCSLKGLSEWIMVPNHLAYSYLFSGCFIGCAVQNALL
jgi:hypothetical protein